jgi:hypothetical protein
LLLQSCLGLQIEGTCRRLSFNRPALPPFLERVEIRRLSIGDARVDLILDRYQEDVSIVVARRDGDVEIVVAK